MSKGRQLHNPGRIMAGRPGHNRAVRLGDALSELVENQILPQQARFGPVIELWSEALPTELGRHCRIVDISRGQLKVQVDSSSYMYELRLCCSQLLGEIQRRCPQARIQKIKIVLG